MASTISWETIKSKPISLSLVIGIFYGVYWLVNQGLAWSINHKEWHYITFVTKAQAAEQVQTVSKKVDQNSRIILELRDQLEFDQAIGSVEHLETKLYYAKRDQDERGATRVSEERIKEISDDLEKAEKYLDCLVKGSPNCQHIKGRHR